MKPRARARVLGVHPVDAPEACHLVELAIHGLKGPLDVGRITQPCEGVPKSDWQVPWDERRLEPSAGELRIAFFFHYLDLERPIHTPWGSLRLPDPSPRPERLRSIRYEAP